MPNLGGNEILQGLGFSLLKGWTIDWWVEYEMFISLLDRLEQLIRELSQRGIDSLVFGSTNLDWWNFLHQLIRSTAFS